MALERTPSDDHFWNAAWPEGPHLPPVHNPPPSQHLTQFPEVLLRRIKVWKRKRFARDGFVEEFELRLPITYLDNSDKKVGERVITVPDPSSQNTFKTDLTSVPRLFTWLVPKSGVHLPAALIHDGLIGAAAGDYLVVPKTPDPDNPGNTIDRIDADAVFRNAMQDLDVGLIRRWLVWAAVANASLVSGARPGWRLKRWWFRIAGALAVAFILWCGLSATLEVLDVERLPRGLGWVMSLDLPWTGGHMDMGDLPWISERMWLVEIAQGLAGAIVIPLGLALLLWGRYLRAGAIAGVALATLFHATVLVAAVAVSYQVVEFVAKSAHLALFLAVAVTGCAGVLFIDTICA